MSSRLSAATPRFNAAAEFPHALATANRDFVRFVSSGTKKGTETGSRGTQFGRHFAFHPCIPGSLCTNEGKKKSAASSLRGKIVSTFGNICTSLTSSSFIRKYARKFSRGRGRGWRGRRGKKRSGKNGGAVRQRGVYCRQRVSSSSMTTTMAFVRSQHLSVIAGSRSQTSRFAIESCSSNLSLICTVTLLRRSPDRLPMGRKRERRKRGRVCPRPQMYHYISSCIIDLYH